MAMDTAVTNNAPVQLVQGEGAKHQLLLEALVESRVPAWEIRHSQTQAVLAKVQGALPAGYTLTAFAGKGGDVLYAQTPNGLVLFLLPGSVWKVNDLTVEVLGNIELPEGDAVAAAHAEPVRSAQKVTHQATVLGAGVGSRILPLTLPLMSVGKPALPLDDRHTVIGRVIYQLAENNIQRIIINTCYHRDSVAKAMQDAVETVNAPEHANTFPLESPLQLTEVIEERPTGTAGGLLNVLQHPGQYPGALDKNQPLLVVQGDAVCNTNFGELLQAHQQNNALVTIGCQWVEDRDVDKFGIIATKSAHPQVDPSGEIDHFIEKPSLAEAGPHRLGSTGFYVLSPQALAMVEDIHQALLTPLQEKARAEGQPVPEAVPEFDFAKHLFPAFLKASQEKTVLNDAGVPMVMWAQQVHGAWSDIGNPEQYAVTLREVLSGQIAHLPLWDSEINAAQLAENGVMYWHGTAQDASSEGYQLAGNVLVTRPFA